MQLFKTAITEMKERGLNRGRPPGARGIFDRVSQLEKFSKGFSSGPTSSNANQKSNVEFGSSFSAGSFYPSCFLLGVESRMRQHECLFQSFSVLFSKFDEEGKIDEKFVRMDDPFGSSNEFSNDC